MKYYAIETDWDEKHNSLWDALWSSTDHGDLDCLRGSFPLATIWNSPEVTLAKRSKTPDVFSFELHYAVNAKTRDIIAAIADDEVEFLPLKVPNYETVYLIHPLWPVDFDDQADVHCNSVSKNITVVKKYSFTIDPYYHNLPRHMFCMRQAKGSAARDGGYTLGKIIVSEDIKNAFDKHGVTGVQLIPIHETSDE